MKTILAFSGSNSKNSINQQLIHAVAKLEVKCNIEIIDLRDFPAPLYGIDEEVDNGIPPSMQLLREKFRNADGFLISSPEHNGSMPAFMKSVLDWQSRQEGKIFMEKPAVFLSTSPGPRGGASALKHILEIMPFRGAVIIGGHSVGSFSEKVTNGILNEGEDKEIILKLLTDLIGA